jgi:hypothetical protein
VRAKRGLCINPPRCHATKGASTVHQVHNPASTVTGPSRRLPRTRDYQRGRLLRRVELFRIHKSPKKPQPLGLRFCIVLTEGNTKRIEWQMS